MAELDRDKTRDQLGDTVHLEGHRAALVIAVVFIGYSSAFAQNVVHNARGFECGFIYEKTKNGKSGDASCSYTGETVFSSASRSLPRNEHCYTKNVFSYEDFNLQIDLAASKVVWDREDGLAPFAFTRMVEYYMRTEKIGKEEATRRVAEPRPVMKQVTYDILGIHKGDEFVSQDPITQALPKKLRNMPVYTLTFGRNDGNSLFTLFVPDDGANGNSILSRYWADGTSSWVSMRFGKCRVLRQPGR
ncbi:hypothetical protein [Nitrobacter sp. TKz-YC01]|uniref:hypothetical protein n=1 Tax=Nitrobacter sp. TKz-YC01 TaxID=3398703 RepID=UPI003A0FCCEC